MTHTVTRLALALATVLALALAGRASAADSLKSAAADGSGKANAPLGSPDYHPSADRPVGWRGDGSGRFPGATPPLEWYRQPKGGFMGIRVLAGKPKGSAPEGEPLNMGMVREWLVAGPFEAKDHGSALQDVSLANETALQPTAGASLGGKPWTLIPVSVAKQTGGNGHLVVDLAMAFGQSGKQGSQNHPGTIDPLVAYASTCLYAPEVVQVRLFIQGQKVMGWLNGVAIKIPGQWEAPPALELKAGWNVLTIKAASSKELWNMSATLFPTAAAGYETKNIQWMAPMPGPSWSSPIIVGSKVFVSADGGTLVCLNKADGQVLWTRSQTFYDAVSDEERAKFPDLKAKSQELEKMMLALPDKLNSGLSNDGSRADQNQPMKEAIKQKCDLEHQIQAAMAKGDRKAYECWDNDRGTSTPTPTSDGKYVYAAFWGGNKSIGANLVTCYDLEGRRMWTSFTGQTGIGEHGTHTSPALSGKFVVYLSGSTLLAYDKASGKLVWSKKEETFGGASVVPLKIAGGDAVLVPQLGIFRTADGTEIFKLWKTDLQTEKPTPCVVDGTVYGLSDKDVYYSYEIGDGHPQGMVQKPWKDISLQLGGIYNDLVMGAPLFDHGMTYIISEGCGLSVVEGRTGKPVYSKAMESLNPRLCWVFTVGACTGPNLAGKVIHVRDDQSQTIVIATGPQYKELAKNVLWELLPDGKQQEAQSNPYYEGNRMYYRTQGFLYCIGEK